MFCSVDFVKSPLCVMLCHLVLKKLNSHTARALMSTSFGNQATQKELLIHFFQAAHLTEIYFQEMWYVRCDMSLTNCVFVSYPWKLPSAAPGRPSYQRRWCWLLWRGGGLPSDRENSRREGKLVGNIRDIICVFVCLYVCSRPSVCCVSVWVMIFI